MTRQLTLGPITILYENGFLRYVRAGEQELVRMLYFALRDAHWGTFEPVITDEHVSETGDGFAIRYVCSHYTGNTEIFRWQAQIEATTTDAVTDLTFTIDGEARATFGQNRAGFCVLHPIRETVGQPVTITHPDGSRTASEFPQLISPHQPFFDIQGMAWAVGSVRAELRFEGDVFETEDQRNWTDTSFKTYCTPLSRPKPVTLHPGDTVRQRVTLRIDGAAFAPAPDDLVTITLDEAAVTPFPRIGTGHAIGQPLPTGTELTLLNALQFDHLRLDLRLDLPDWRNTLQTGLAEAQALGVPVELALTFGPEPAQNWQDVVTALCSIHAFTPAIIQCFTLFTTTRRATSDELLTALLPLIRRAFPDAWIGAGSNIHFTDLNRNHFDFGRVDYVSYAMNPQIHAFDDRSLTENLEAQADTVRSARQFIGDKPIHVSPVTLRPRFNPEAVGEESRDPAELPYDVDHRQATPFAAAWTLGSLKYLSESGVAALTLFESHGLKGFLLGERDVRHPKSPANKGVFPVYDLLRLIRAFGPTEVVRSASSRPLAVSSWVLRKPGETVLVLANHTAQPLTVQIHNQTFTLPVFSIHGLPPART